MESKFIKVKVVRNNTSDYQKNVTNINLCPYT